MLGPGQALNLRILSAQTYSVPRPAGTTWAEQGDPRVPATLPQLLWLVAGRSPGRRSSPHMCIPQWHVHVDTIVLSDMDVWTPQWHIHVDTVVLSEAHAWTPWYWGIQQCISESSNQTRSSQQLRMEGKEDILPILWTFQDRKIVLKI